MDAPYDKPITQAAYENLRKGGWFAPGALFVVEQARDTVAAVLAHAECCDERIYGKAKLVVYRMH